MNNRDLLQRITLEKNEDEISPCIRDTHVSVIEILELIADGLSIAEICKTSLTQDPYGCFAEHDPAYERAKMRK